MGGSEKEERRKTDVWMIELIGHSLAPSSSQLTYLSPFSRPVPLTLSFPFP